MKMVSIFMTKILVKNIRGSLKGFLIKGILGVTLCLKR